MIVFVDLDGVLVDFVGGACRWHGKGNPYDDPLRPEAAGEWSLEKLLGLDPGLFWAGLGIEFWEGLPWTEDGGQILELAEQHAGGAGDVCLLSSPCLTVGCLEGKRAWIDRHLPAYSRRFLLGPPKELVAGPGKLLIDDSDANVTRFRDRGGRAALVARPWNSAHGLARPRNLTLGYLRECLARIPRA